MNLLHTLRIRLLQKHLFVFLLLGMLLPNLFLLGSPYLSPIGKLINILIPLGVYGMLFSLVRRPGWGYWWCFLFVLMNMVQLVLLTVFSGSVIAVDVLMSTFSASGDEAGELLSGLLLPIIATSIAYLFFSLIALWSVRRTDHLTIRQRRIAFYSAASSFLLGLGLSPIASAQQPNYKIISEVYPLNVCSNIYLSAKMVRAILDYPQTSKDFSFGAKSSHDPKVREIYVMVIGETSRACSWSLYGYDRPTTPLLSARRDELVWYRDVLTQSNTTAKSVPILLSPADAHHPNRLPQVKGLLEAYREAGFYTIFLSNQPANRSFVDYFAFQSNEHHSIREELRGKQPDIYDTDLLPYLDRALASGKQKLLIVLHGYGSHFKYQDRYAEGEGYFEGDNASSASEGQKSLLVNGYDNALRHTDKLLDGVIQSVRATEAEAGVFYIADHGEDLFDDRRERILHSSPSVSYYQLHVPCLLWLSPAYKASYPEEARQAKENQAHSVSSNVAFHTMLELGGVQTRERLDSLSLLNSRCVSLPRYYLNDRYETVPISQMGLTEEDLRQMKERGLQPY